MCFDNTNFEKIKEALLDVYQNLEIAKQQSIIKSRILAHVCHQLRTPLNIISFSNSLIKRSIDELNQEAIIFSYVENIQLATQEINQILDDIFILLEIESEKIGIETTSINLLDFCKRIREKLLIIYRDKNINITSEGNCSEVYIYQKLLEPILNNLLDNALKYSPNNSMVNLIISCDQQKITFKIKDQGLGISQVDQQKVFQPFYRGSNVNQIPGTGMGLSIVKTFVELYQGEISIVSKIGLGTTVNLIIPSKESINSNSS